MAIIAILGVLLLVLVGGAYYAYRVAFFSPRKGREKIPTVHGSHYDVHKEEISRIFHQLHDRPCETVTITSHDGLQLNGRYYHTADGAPLDIAFHGYRSSCFTDFAGGAELSFRMGHNLLLVDQRAHGKSQGTTISFGILERRDVLAWVNYAMDRFGKDIKILLFGVSMGASTVLMASEMTMPSNVKGIVADCPYSSPMEIIMHVAKKMPIPAFLIRPFVILGAKIFGGFDILECTAEGAVKNSKTPILIIHGESDGFVPCDMSDISSANPAMVTRHTFPNADHGISYLVDTPRYQNIVTEFSNKIL